MLAEALPRYDLLEPIAAGGMGEVFRGRVRGEHGFNKIVAVKRVLPQLANDPQFVVRFVGEAKLAVSLSHANVVQVFDLCRAGSDLYLIMEYVHGADLDHVLGATAQRGERVGVPFALHVAEEALKALAYAHGRAEIDRSARAVVHCDISPSNLLLSYAGEVKVTDFGVAQVVSDLRRTQRGEVRGKVRYMPPEQLRGEALDGRADLYALGVVLYEMLTLRPLFDREDAADAGRRARPQSLQELRDDVPLALADLVGRVLSPKKEQRPASASELLSEMMKVSHAVGPPVTAPEVGQWVRRIKPPAESGTAPDDMAGAVKRLLRIGGAPRTATAPDDPFVGSATATRTFVGHRADDGTLVWDPAPAERRRGSRAAWMALVLLAPTIAGGIYAAKRMNGPAASPMTAPPTAPTVATAATPMAPTPSPAIAEPKRELAAPVVVAPPTSTSPEERRPARRATNARPAARTGWVNVYAEPWARVLVDGKAVGTTPLMKLALAEGVHRIHLEHPQAKPLDRTVRVRADQTELVNVDLSVRR
jgi:hypothetical protein